jgi:hypothetical protein
METPETAVNADEAEFIDERWVLVLEDVDDLSEEDRFGQDAASDVFGDLSDDGGGQRTEVGHPYDGEGVSHEAVDFPGRPKLEPH